MRTSWLVSLNSLSLSNSLRWSDLRGSQILQLLF
jgi:hypothetical protein